MAELQTAFINGVIGVLVVLVSMLFNTVKVFLSEKSKSLQSKRSVQEYDLLQNIAMIAVQAVEQLGKTLQIDPKEKFEQAVSYVLTEAQRHHLHVTRTQIEPLVESFVKEMNDVKTLALDKLTE